MTQLKLKGYQLKHGGAGQTLIVDPDTSEVIGCVLGMKQFIDGQKAPKSKPGEAKKYPNKFGGRCRKCGQHVAVGAGTHSRDSGLSHNECPPPAEVDRSKYSRVSFGHYDGDGYD